MIISFDIGGVLTRYPDIVRSLMERLRAVPGCTIYLLTDMPASMAPQAVADTYGVYEGIHYDAILCGDWNTHGEQCKAVLIREYGIQVHFDDYPAYCVTDSDCMTLFVWPRPDKPYRAEVSG